MYLHEDLGLILGCFNIILGQFSFVRIEKSKKGMGWVQTQQLKGPLLHKAL